jgi:hypothetical protein
MLRRGLIWCALALPLLAACGDDEPVTTPGTDSGTSADAATGDADGMTDAGEDATMSDAGEDAAPVEDVAPDVPELECESPGPIDPSVDTTPDPACGVDWVVFVEGTIADDAGQPVECAFTQLCLRGEGRGDVVCLQPVRTGPDGAYRVDVPSQTRCVREGSMRILVPGEDRATTYCHIEPSEGAVTDAGTLSLYSTTRVAELPPYGDGAMVRDIAFDGGLVIEVQPEHLGFGTEAEERYGNLASVRLDPADPSLCFLEDTSPLGLWAFSPEANVSEDNTFTVRFPNDSALDAGTVVDIYVLGGLGTTNRDGGEIAEASWEVVGTATVSEDGSEIVGLAENGGVPILSFLAYALPAQ